MYIICWSPVCGLTWYLTTFSLSFFPFISIRHFQHPGVCGEPWVDPYAILRLSHLCLQHSTHFFWHSKALEPYLTAICCCILAGWGSELSGSMWWIQMSGRILFVKWVNILTHGCERDWRKAEEVRSWVVSNWSLDKMISISQQISEESSPDIPLTYRQLSWSFGQYKSRLRASWSSLDSFSTSFLILWNLGGNSFFFFFFFLHCACTAGRCVEGWTSHDTNVPHPEDAQSSLELSRVVQEESYYCHL